MFLLRILIQVVVYYPARHSTRADVFFYERYSRREPTGPWRPRARASGLTIVASVFMRWCAVPELCRIIVYTFADSLQARSMSPRPEEDMAAMVDIGMSALSVRTHTISFSNWHLLEHAHRHTRAHSGSHHLYALHCTILGCASHTHACISALLTQCRTLYLSPTRTLPATP